MLLLINLGRRLALNLSHDGGGGVFILSTLLKNFFHSQNILDIFRGV